MNPTIGRGPVEIIQSCAVQDDLRVPFASKSETDGTPPITSLPPPARCDADSTSAELNRARPLRTLDRFAFVESLRDHDIDDKRL
jgi:hypothetical protein